MNYSNFHHKIQLKLEKNWEHYAITCHIVTTHSFTNSIDKLNVDNSNIISNFWGSVIYMFVVGEYWSTRWAVYHRVSIERKSPYKESYTINSH